MATISSGKPKEILLIGYGAVGAVYAFILSRGGARVTVAARSNFRAVNEKGLDVRSEKYGEHLGWRAHRVVGSVKDAADQAYDYVVWTTKALPELTTSPELLAPVLDAAYTSKFPQPVYVNMQNGLDVERDLYEALVKAGHKPQIIGTAVYIGTKTAGENTLIHSTFDRMSLGVYRYDDYTSATNSPQETSILEPFASMITEGGSSATIVPDIQRVKFNKNFWNVAFSSTVALTRHPLTALFCPPALPSSGPVPASATQGLKLDDHAVPALKGALHELVSIARAIGWSDAEDTGVPASHVDKTFENTARLHRVPDNGLMPSMLVDTLAGRPIEVEVIFGNVVRLARRYGVETPRIDVLYALLLVLQNQMLQKYEAERS
ncbi:unnamed protein product [Peniophora sp. CBMAI 1063]|nr:unnamed protein product [Peniophora sp. CBMAI 1063]